MREVSSVHIGMAYRLIAAIISAYGFSRVFPHIYPSILWSRYRRAMEEGAFACLWRYR
jgi:hypothetical protein